jgi:hypothetical protein
VAREPDYGANHIDPGNSDPIQHSWNPGPVEEQRAHFRPERISQADMGPMPTSAELVDRYQKNVNAKPEREGPDYNDGMGDDGVGDSFYIHLSMSADLMTERAQWILQNVVPTALRSFVRQHLQYGDTDKSLGYQGQFAELFHINAKLKRLMWDNNFTGLSTTTAVGEIREELESLIGHALLALDLLDKGNKDGRA